MDIRNTRRLKTVAAHRVANAPQEKRIVLIYGLILTALALGSTGIQFALSRAIDGLGGLSNMATRSMLSTVQSMLPMVQSMVNMCLTVGYTAAMLRIARGQYSSPNTLRLGFARFWTLLRCTVIQGLYYSGLVIIAIYAASMLFVISPWGTDFMEQAAPMLAETSLLTPAASLDESTVLSLIPTMIPMFFMIAAILCLLVVPAAFRFRMVNYIIIDKPGIGAMAALRESRKMMRRNCLKLLKLDLSYWWYFLVLLAASMVGNADLWLPLLGMELNMNADLAYFLFFALYLAAQLAVYYFLRNPMETAYALAYDSLKPEEPKPDGVVLGNIFQM